MTFLFLHSMMEQNHKLTVSYDGTDYHGWQRQPGVKTIQEEIEKSLTQISGKKITVVGAGRTDAGVHALGQTAHFKASLSLQPEEMTRALNSILPPDIRVIEIQKMNPEFHARKSALSKVYQYRIFNSPLISPFVIRYVTQWRAPLQIQAMKEASQLFVRKADFSPFSSNRKLDPIRNVMRSVIQKKGAEIIYTVEADGFLRYMVRTMVGTLLEIGRGKRSPESIEVIFRNKDRSQAGSTAPAKGLCLLKVNYPE